MMPTDASSFPPLRPVRTVLYIGLLWAAALSGAAEVESQQPAQAAPPPTLDSVVAEITDPLDQVERQIDVQEYAGAIDWLERRIDHIEQGSHRFDDRLIRPLTLLGDAYTGTGDHEAALGHYQRAVHLTRVNHGLTAPGQVAIVYREASAYKALRDYQQANSREEYAYHVLSRAHDPLDEALLPGIYHLAGWYQSTNNVFAARVLYEQAIAILDTHGKANTHAAIPALQGVALSYRLERFPRFYSADLEATSSIVPASTLQRPVSVNNFPAGEAALQQVIQIRQATEPADPVAIAESVLDLADWYTLFDKAQRAEPLYGHAWELMADVETFDIASYFAEPRLLYYPAPSAPSPPPAETRGEPVTGFVEVAFDVTVDGQVRSLDTVASEPDGLMDFRVRKSLRLARYRPMLVDGVPVAKARHTYRHEFPYYAPRPAEPAVTSDAEPADTALRGER